MGKASSVSVFDVEDVSIGLTETGLNTFLVAFFTARGRFIRYGTPFFVNQTGPLATQVPRLPIPGFPNGMEYELVFDIPAFDLYPPDSATPPLPPLPNGFVLTTRGSLTIRNITGNVTSNLEVLAQGKINHTSSSSSTGNIGVDVSDVMVVGVAPSSLKLVIEAIIKNILSTSLAAIQLPFNALTIDFFTLNLLRGPETADDEIKLFGGIS